METIERKAFVLTYDEKKIIYVPKKKGTVEYFTYNEELLKILLDCALSPFVQTKGKSSDRLRFKKTLNGKALNFRDHDLAFACYTNRLHADTFLEDWKEYQEEKRRLNMTIDHIDGNVNNNTRYNLSWMGQDLNKRKANIVGRVVSPNALNGAYVDGKYRIEFSSVYLGIEVSVRFLCGTAEEFVNRLYSIVNYDYEWEWAEPMRHKNERNGKYTYTWIPKDGDCVYKDIERSIRKQKEISRLSEKQFFVSEEYDQEKSGISINVIA